MKSLLKTVLATLMILTTAMAARAEPLVVGANIGNVPWEFAERGGEFVGFEIDLARAVAGRLGRELEILNIPFNGLFAAVQSGRIDIAISSITITPRRLQSVDFAQPYYDSAQSLTVLARGGAQSLADMRGKVIGVDTGSTGDIWASQRQAEYGFGEIRRYEGLAPAMLDLQSMRIDGYLSDIPALLHYVRDKPFFAVVQRIETGERYSMMFARGNPLTAEVDAIIGALKTDGTMAELHRRWFGVEAEPGSATLTVLPRPGADAPDA